MESSYTDNRDHDVMHDYQQARIDALKSRVRQLEEENAELQARLNWRLQHESELEAIR